MLSSEKENYSTLFDHSFIDAATMDGRFATLFLVFVVYIRLPKIC